MINRRQSRRWPTGHAASISPVVIKSPAVESVFCTGTAGSVSGTVTPANTPVTVHDHATGTKIGDAVVVGMDWSFEWTSTTDQYGVISIDARADGRQSAPLAVRVVTEPHTLFSALNWYYGWKGCTLGTGDYTTKLLSWASYGSLEEPLVQATETNAPDVASSPGTWGGHQYLNYGSTNDHTLRLQSSGAATSAQPLTLVWCGVRTGAAEASKIVVDGQDSNPRTYITTSANAAFWQYYCGTALTSGAATNVANTLFCYGANDALNSVVDWLDTSGIWHDGTAGNAGTNGREGATTNRYINTYTGLGHKCLFMGWFSGKATADQKTQFARWKAVIDLGLPFA